VNEYRSNADALDMITSVVVRSPLLREGLIKVLTDAGVSVHCENPTREVALIVRAMRHCGADLVILDGSLCEAPSELVVSLRQELLGSRIVIITTGDNVKRIPDESIAVADGILSAETSKEEIILSLRLIKLGGRVVPPNLLSRLLGAKLSDQSDEPVPSPNRVHSPAEQPPSRREVEILRHLTVGSSNKTIARQLGIAEATVKVHMKGVLRKIRAANRTQAAIWAMNNGIGVAGRATMTDAVLAHEVGSAD
jgi:two-component system nitrate/nitrite response regulator NarL